MAFPNKKFSPKKGKGKMPVKAVKKGRASKMPPSFMPKMGGMGAPPDEC